MSELRDRILSKALNLNRTVHFVEDWNESVYLQELTGKQLADFSEETYEVVDGLPQAKPIDAMINILYYSLVDEDGERLFTKRELKSISGTILLELGTIAFEVNDISNDKNVNEAKAELVKNVEGSSTSD